MPTTHHYYCCLCLLLCSLLAPFAATHAQSSKGGDGNLVVGTPNIDKLLQLHIIAARNRSVQGYRLQISQETNRDLVRNDKALLLQQYPDLKTYELYQSPHFKLKAGDFTNRMQAFKLQTALKPSFKRVVIVPDRVIADL